LNNNLNASYLPFKNVLKNDTSLGSVALNNQINVMKKTIEENQTLMNDPSNFDSNYSKTQNSFTKQSYFNSMAFKSVNNFGVNGTDQGTGKYHTNLNSNTGTSNYLNSMILPETNFSGYKNLINKSEKLNINSHSNNIRNDSEQGIASNIFIKKPIRKWKSL